MERKIRIIETLCVIGIILLSAVILVGILLLYGMEQPAVPQPPSDEVALTEWTDHLPDAIHYGQKLPVTAFRAADGSMRDLNDWAGKKLMLLFWGSWCPYCGKALGAWEAYESVLAEYPDYGLILINKLDPGKGETVEKAQAYLSDNAIPFECLYDEGLKAWQAYGVRRIPTLLILDGQGYLRCMTADAPESDPELRALLAWAESGGAAATERFLTASMIGADGGVYTTYMDRKGASPTGRDVLSESQGLLMAYAALTQNRALFEQSWRYAKEKLRRDGVFAWYAMEDGTRADANALMDDLRIYRALKSANALWGGLDSDVADLASAIIAHNASAGQPVGFYDFRQQRAGSTIPLCYLDLEALGDLGLRQRAEDILLGGYIGDAFPLYYAAYDYSSGTYSASSLNTSEALMTLYHAVKGGVARRESLKWLERQVVSGTLAARYGTDGRVVKGFDYHSTAVYAIAALIGAAAGNARLYTCARRLMERYAVTEPSALQGSFSDRADGSDIIAFDQLMPLLVYAGTKDITFDTDQ